METFIDLDKKYFVKQDSVGGQLINLVGEFDPDYLQSFVEENMAQGNPIEASQPASGASGPKDEKFDDFLSSIGDDKLPDVNSPSAPGASEPQGSLFGDIMGSIGDATGAATNIGNRFVEDASNTMENSLPDVPSINAPVDDSLLPHDDPNYKPPEH